MLRSTPDEEGDDWISCAIIRKQSALLEPRIPALAT